MEFYAWMKMVDERIAAELGGLDSGDIDDWNYRDAYNDGVDPTTAALEALENAGFTWE